MNGPATMPNNPRWPRSLRHGRRKFPAALALCFLAIAHSASATVVLINDAFTGADNTALVGRAPAPTDAPSASYAGNGNVSLTGGITGGTPYEADIQSNTARVGSDAGLGLDLGITSATQFELSITFNISGDTETQVNNPRRGAGLGFFSSVSVASGGSSHGFNNFTGLAVDRSSSVRLIVSGADSGIFTTVAGFNPATNHTLAFDVNTASGAGSIYNIILDGGSVALAAPANTFTIARTVYGGFYNSSGLPSEVATFDDFYIATVPEPGSLIPILAIAALVGGRQYRSRNRPRHRL